LYPQFEAKYSDTLLNRDIQSFKANQSKVRQAILKSSVLLKLNRPCFTRGIEYEGHELRHWFLFHPPAAQGPQITINITDVRYLYRTTGHFVEVGPLVAYWISSFDFLVLTKKSDCQ